MNTGQARGSAVLLIHILLIQILNFQIASLSQGLTVHDVSVGVDVEFLVSELLYLFLHLNVIVVECTIHSATLSIHMAEDVDLSAL